MLEHTSHPFLWLGAGLSSFVAVLFGIPAGAIGAAVLGCLVGIMISEAISVKAAFKMMFLCVVSSAFLSPLLIDYFGDYSIKSVCFVVAVALSWSLSRKALLTLVQKFLKTGDFKELKP